MPNQTNFPKNDKLEPQNTQLFIFNCIFLEKEQEVKKKLQVYLYSCLHSTEELSFLCSTLHYKQKYTQMTRDRSRLHVRRGKN
jgi:hypothetical protein